ncbi:MAG: hypothetical protein ABIY55_02585 [Kofleriaceae bacterium]
MASEPDSSDRAISHGEARAAANSGTSRIRRCTRDPRLRTLLIVVAVCATLIAVRWRWNELVGAHVPCVYYDTQIYDQIADQPIGVGLLFAPKPLIVPLVYRLAGNDHASIVAWQENLSFVSWAVLAASLTLGLRRRWTRVLAIGVCMAFLLAPVRLGFTGSLLSESINDSLTTLVVAGAIGLVWLRGRARRAAAIVTAVLGLCWLLTRDTNAVTAVVAAAGATIVWRGWRHRWARVAAVMALASAAFVLWTASIPHAPLGYQHDWYARFTPRSVYPMLDNISLRIYREHADELPSGLRAFGGAELDVERVVRAGPEHRAAQDWLVDQGPSTYARWLLRHPLDRLRELIGARWIALTGTKTVYMPKHWVAHGGALRQLTQQRNLLLALLFAAPVLLWRPRADPLRGLALCLIASGLFGVAAAYYGDAAEVSRHCYGPGQQVVLGLFLALVAWLDRISPRWPGRRASPEPRASKPLRARGAAGRQDERAELDELGR